jgi:hypothetical protein
VLETRVHAECDVHCAFSATIALIERLFSTGADYRVGPFRSIRTHVQLEAAQVRDTTDQTRIHDALRLRWEAPPRFPLPVMHGLITVRPRAPVTELHMEGTYDPPLGALGRVFDRIVGRHIAQRTMNRFLSELRDFVQKEWETPQR